MKCSKSKNKIKSQEKNRYNIFYNPLYIFILVIAALLFALSIQFNSAFKSTTFEKIIYNLINMDSQEMSFSFMKIPILKVSSSFIIILCISIIPLFLYFIYKKEIYITIKNKKILIYPFKINKWALSLLGVALVIIMISLNVPKFVVSTLDSTKLYEEEYVEYEDELIKFPDKKRNLITIYVESFENSVFSIENGGLQDESYMPNIEKLTSQYINFSNTNKIGGFHQVNGASWTAAALVAHTSGIPIYIGTKNGKGSFLNGAVSIGEILEDNGYKNYFLLGSNAKFADKKDYFSQHGNYLITDYYGAKGEGLIAMDYHAWWGYEDSKLYEFAKDKILNIAESEEPFNFSMLTADTHFYDGYVDDVCPNKFESHYANSYYCTDIMLSNFIEWIQEQDFYQDTTIVIVGDHLTMRDDFFNSSDNYERTIYNLFINSTVGTSNTINRNFTAFDIFPTTLAAIGVSIKGDRLALGTNLFSGEQTLMEELGEENFYEEISKNSKYYKQNILYKS